MARNHLVTGNVTYTTVGTPTIVDGIVSGFSTSNYLRLPNLPGQVSEYFTVRYPFVEQIAFNSGNSNIVGYLLYGNMSAIVYTNGNNRYIQLVFNNGNDAIYVNGNVVIQDNTDYVLRISFDGSKVISEIKQESGSFVQDAISNEIVTFISDYEFIGVRPAAAGSEFGGSIDLKETYIMVNGQAWFGKCPVEVKHINYGTRVGYTKVGNPTIVNGIMTGSSGRVDIIDNSSINLWAQNSFDVNYVFKTEDVSQIPDNTIFTLYREKLDGTGTQQGGAYYSNGNRTLYLYFGYDSEGNSLESSLVLQNNTKYAIKFSKEGIGGKIYVSTNDSSYNVLASFNDVSGTKYSNASQNIFAQSNIAQNLNETYIKINGDLWFFKPCVNYQVHNGKLVFADAGLYIQEPGSADYTVVGNPTISNGVVSDFSQSNYLTIDKAPTAPITSIEIVLDLTMPQTFNNEYDTILARKTTDKYAPMFQIAYGGALNVFVYDTYGSQTFIGSYTISSHFQIKLAGDDSTRLYVYTRPDSSSEWVVQNDDFWRGMTWDADLILGTNAATTGFFEGAINLNESYIKINGQMWWSGAGGAGTKVYASKNIAPVPAGYKGQDDVVSAITVGSPTIVNGVASGFSGSDYLNISSSTDLNTITSFISRVKFKANGISGLSGISGIGDGYFGFYQADSNIRCIVVNFSDLTFDDVFVTSINANTDYWFEYAYENGTISVRYSTDGTTWTSIATPSTQYALALSTLNNFMYGYSYKGAFNGSIDLNETYIKLNGEPWFTGKNNAPTVGYFDMRTQTFTAAPAGSTIGRDE